MSLAEHRRQVENARPERTAIPVGDRAWAVRHRHRARWGMALAFLCSAACGTNTTPADSPEKANPLRLDAGESDSTLVKSPGEGDGGQVDELVNATPIGNDSGTPPMGSVDASAAESDGSSATDSGGVQTGHGADGGIVPSAGDGGPGGDGPVLTINGRQLKIQVCEANIIRVAYAADPAFFSRVTPATLPKHCDAVPWTAVTGFTEVIVTTALLKAHVNLQTGAVTFNDATDQPILAEASGGRTITAAQVQGQTTNHIQQQWQPNAGESLYGLGQHQDGSFDIKGYDLDFHQYNTQVYVPAFVSSRGYGILWDNMSFTRFGDLRQPAPLPGLTYDASGYVSGAATGTVNWTGQVQAPTTGDYLFYAFSSGNVTLDVNNVRVVDHWRQGWNPSTDIAKVSLTAGQSVPVHLTWASDIAVNEVSLLWKTPPPSTATSLWSEVADGVDYYFVYGPELDDVIAGYRRLTGTAPMMPRWAYGFWQSRDHYMTAQESLDVLSGYRSRTIPIDNIVQDWQYWPTTGWGSHQFDPTRFPDPQGWINAIHNTYHAHVMISVWPKFYPGTANFTALNSAGYLYQPDLTEHLLDFQNNAYTYYDAFNPAARTLYWSQIQTGLFSKGIDAWWADASEPDIVDGTATSAAAHLESVRTHMNPTALGTASSVLNAYSLHHSRSFYEGQRAAAPNQRVFILTRNGFAGQQRYAAATWSGDITSTWTAFRKQVRTGLGFSISGIPYWTMDSGGYAVPTRFSTNPTAAALDEWRELNARWYEYAAFLPIFRVHGQAPNREMWEFGGNTSAAYLAELKFDRLRYQLLPYLYSLAGAVTQDASTILRPLVMDFRTDLQARDVDDQFMFGKAFLVSPVMAYQARTRAVYLPAGAGGWYDFWTGLALAGGQTIQAPAAYDAMPVHVRAGSIVPVGPALQYASELPEDPITLYVYAGADGTFSLYEDEGINYNYENGAFSRIPLSWSDATKTLTIGKKLGSFSGMLTQRTFNVVLVTKTNPVGFSSTPTAGQVVHYAGDAMTVTLN